MGRSWSLSVPEFLSTLSLRRATVAASTSDVSANISIHALLAESDLTIMLYDATNLIFLSTLSLRRATSSREKRKCPEQSFLSTLSLRRATCVVSVQVGGDVNFYPRSPCGERQPATSRNDKHDIFLSTLSLRRATAAGVLPVTLIN